MIGPAGGSGGYDSFGFLVCTPNWLADQLAEKGPLLGHGYLFLPRYDYVILRETIDALCRRTEGLDWDAIGEKLNRYAHWEYEDYRPSLPRQANGDG